MPKHAGTVLMCYPLRTIPNGYPVSCEIWWMEAPCFFDGGNCKHKRTVPAVVVHKTGFEKQILWQLPDKGY